MFVKIKIKEKKLKMPTSLFSQSTLIGFCCLVGLLCSGSVIKGQETKSESVPVETQSKTTLLDSIRKEADSVEFFSLPLFLELCEADLDIYDYDKNKVNVVFFPITYGRFCAYDAIYEVAKNATHDEIVECLLAYGELSPKESAFVLASVNLYVWRSEDPDALKAVPENERVEPLSKGEKYLFSLIVQDSSRDNRTAFEAIEGWKDEWEANFRESSFLFQYYLGSDNMFCPFSADTEKMWRRVCEETPIVVLYSMLAMETRLDPYKLDLPTSDSVITTSGSRQTDSAAELSDDFSVREINVMKHYLQLQIALSTRRPGKDVAYDDAPELTSISRIGSQRLSDVARQVAESFSTMKSKDLPTLSQTDDP